MYGVLIFHISNCNFKSTNKHATSFARLMFISNFRALHCWRLEDITNKRKGFHYGAMFSLPEVDHALEGGGDDDEDASDGGD